MLFFGVIKQLQSGSSVRSPVQTSVQDEPVMRCHILTCELYRPKRAHIVSEAIRRIAVEWQHPHGGVWIVKTPMTAGELRSALLPHLDFQDRLFICEAGEDRAEFNALPAGGGKVMQIEAASSEGSRMLAGIFSRDGARSRHLKAATARSLQSA